MTNYPQLNKEIQDNEIKVIMHTNKGDMTFKLFLRLLKTVENFVTHAKMDIMTALHSIVSLMIL